MSSNKVTSHHARIHNVLCVLIPVLLGACGSNAPNEKVDAGQRKYCDARCFDASADLASEAGGSRDTRDTSDSAIDGGIDEGGRPDLPVDTRFNNDPVALVDSSLGDALSDRVGITDLPSGVSDAFRQELGPEVAPDLGVDTKDAPSGDDVADVQPDVADLPSDRGPDVPADAPDAVDLPPILDTAADTSDTAGAPDIADTARDTVDVPTQIDTSPAPAVCGMSAPSWAKAWNGVAGVPPQLKGMATAGDGTIWTTGQFSSNFNFGSGTLAYGTGTKPTGFVAKLDPGTGLASAAFGFGNPDDKQQAPSGIAVASNGSGGSNVAIIGNLPDFGGTVDFTANSCSGSGSPGADCLTSGSIIDFYVVFDGASSGAYVTPKWAHLVDLGTGRLQAVAADPAQSVFVICGKTSKAVPNWSTSGGSKGLITGGSATFGGGNTDLVVAKIDAAGKVIWGKQYGGLGDQVCQSAALDADGNVIIAGNYSGDLFSLPNVADTSGGTDALFMAKLSAADGTLVNAKTWGAAAGKISLANALAVDSSGNVVMGGYIGNQVDFGGGHVANYAGLNDAFVVKFDPSFNSVWAKGDGDLGYNQIVQSLSVSSTGDVFIAGNFRGTLPYLGLTDSAGGTAATDDAFAAQLAAADGSLVCARSYGDVPGQQFAAKIAVTRAAAGGLADAVFLSGFFTGTLPLGGTTFVSPGNTCSADSDCPPSLSGSASCSAAGKCLNNNLSSAFIARLAH